jgi:hypothetical protein
MAVKRPKGHFLRFIRNRATPTTTITPIIPPMMGSTGRIELPAGGELVEPTVSDTVVE